MKRVFSAWGIEGCELAYRLAEGVERPAFSEETPVLLWTIEVGSLEEAMAIRNLRNGWEPFEPSGEPAHCPHCSAIYYPDDGGQCWRCDHVA
jgi:hypothetical protein